MMSIMRTILRILLIGFRAAGGLVLLGIVILLISLMLPIKIWRTGELPTEPLQLHLAQPFAMPPIRVWIDTDAACGQGRRTDPDDCFAILLLAQQDTVEIVGVSTVFGNAPLADTDRITRALMAQIGKDHGPSIPVYRGSSAPLVPQRTFDATPTSEVTAELRAALERGPLTILALGPLTNIADALEDQPHLQANVTRLVAVMGRRKGHVFHPVEGGTARSFLGHGPVFRDFNFTEDEGAAASVVRMGLPMALVPYEASRNVLLDRSTLRRMEGLDGPAAWVAQRARPWLTYWREEINMAGFYPFDLIAAAYAVRPSLLRCAQVPVAIEDDTWLFGWLGYRGLFVQSEKEMEPPPIASGTLYCPEVSQYLQPWLVDQLTNAHEGTGLQAMAGSS